ncbi:MAG TPA: 4-alpha-glucanotransferase [Candidatus Limnocylindria bacterium]|jgi:4-alpha-glucanotransferase
MTEPGAVEATWTDAWGRRRVTPAAARRAVLAAMQLEPDDARRAGRAVRLARRGDALPSRGDLVLEDGTELGPVREIPPDLPHGYHRWRQGSAERLLLVAPPRCPLPRRWRTWAWAAQLYATRSQASWGIGDLDDLRRLAAWSAGLGAGALLVSPIGATNPAPEPEPSPYYPSSRRFRDPLYIAIEHVPGFRILASELAPLARAGRALNQSSAIVRSEVRRHKLAALERLWRASPAEGARGGPPADGPAAAAWPDLRRWALFAALSELHGPGWRTWPEELRDPESHAVRREGRRLADRIAFHAWLQRLLDRQLAAAGDELRLIGDLPIGFDPGGFDAWVWQAMLGTASLGAPPDVFNPAGQRWGLPPFVPGRLRLAGYRPFADTVRAAMAHAGGLRVDHVLGLFRQWWVPDGAEPADGAYVSQATDELLAVLAIEAERADAVVIGEDLGTVAPGVRRRLAAANVLSTRLAYFERRPPAQWPRKALAGVTTHDLPTVAGTWTGADLADQKRAGLPPDRGGRALLRGRLARLADAMPDAALARVIEQVHAAVGASPSMLAVATLEDALHVRRRPNLPGTDRARRDNWSRALPLSLERIARSRSVRRVARAIGAGRDRP